MPLALSCLTFISVPEPKKPPKELRIRSWEKISISLIGFTWILRSNKLYPFEVLLADIVSSVVLLSTASLAK